MTIFAVIKDGVVVNSIIADDLEVAETVTGAECVQSDTAGIGDIYDEVTGTFSPPSL